MEDPNIKENYKGGEDGLDFDGAGEEEEDDEDYVDDDDEIDDEDFSGEHMVGNFGLRTHAPRIATRSGTMTPTWSILALWKKSHPYFT